MTKKATHRLIDSVWTIEYEIIDVFHVWIHKYSRTDQEGYDNERQLQQGTIIETANRIATELVIRPYESFNGWATKENATEKYIISNPLHIFSYGS